ncbi:MAG: hypothetical protein L0154_05270 [Chloroflexi bacterium]|nr:hypothetical protein [Chloroflexota bacterium]
METNINELTIRLAEYYKAGLTEEWRRFMVYILRELMKGKPVEPARLAELMHQPAEKVRQLLDQGTVPRDEQGRVTELGLTLKPTTPHEFGVNGRTLWVWYAIDLLLFPPILKVSARVKSPCAVTGEPVEIDLTPDTVKSVKPEGAAVSILTTPDATKAICGGLFKPSDDMQEQPTHPAFVVKFFKSADIANEWQKDHLGTIILSVADAYELYKRLAKLWII